jgi:hypothetical protein
MADDSSKMPLKKAVSKAVSYPSLPALQSFGTSSGRSQMRIHQVAFIVGREVS